MKKTKSRNSFVVETAWFKLKPQVSEKDFLAASKKAHDGYLSKCKGFISRELLKAEDGAWLDVVHFRTMEDADAAAKNFPLSPSAREFEQAIDASSARMNRFKVAEKY